jgi:fructose-bisphosphate aldolase class II
MNDKKEAFDPRYYLTPIMDTLLTGVEPNQDVSDITNCLRKGVKEVVGSLIVNFGSVGYASKIEHVSLEEMIKRYKNM